MIKLILQHVLPQGHSQRRCAQALGISKGVVAKYVAAAQAAGLGWPAIEPLAEHLGRRTLQYSQFCERYRQYTKTLKRSMRQVYRAGEKLFVDYASPTLALDDGSRANIFVSAMGASHYTYAQATAGQKTTDWITAMTGALHFMGAVPELIVPDNQRAVIAVPDRYEPRVGDTVSAHWTCGRSLAASMAH